MGFRKIILRRLVDTLAVMALVFVMNFLLLYMRMPEVDPDLPVWENFIGYLQYVFLEGLGHSARGGQPTLEKLSEYLPYTVLLVGASTLYAIAIGAVVGVIAAWRRNEKVDYLLRLGLVLPFAIPIFYWAMILLIIFAVDFRMFPLRGAFTIPPPQDPIIRVVDIAHHLTLPSLVLTAAVVYVFFMTTRGSMLDELKQSYVLTAQAKGMKETSIIFRHVLRNALLPLTSLSGLAFVILITAESMVEYIFSWHGLGLLLYQSIVLRLDLPVLQAIFLFYSAIVLIGSFISDILNCLLDPRIRRALGEADKVTPSKSIRSSPAEQHGILSTKISNGFRKKIKPLKYQLNRGILRTILILVFSVTIIFSLQTLALSSMHSHTISAYENIGHNPATLAQSNETQVTDYVFSMEWGNTTYGPDLYYGPLSIELDSDRIYVTDIYSNMIHVYASNDTIIDGWTHENLTEPIDIDVGPQGWIYITTGIDRIVRLANNGSYLSQWGRTGSEDGEFDNLGGICVDSLGNVYVVDQGNERIQKFTSDGNFITSWGSHGSGLGQFSNPMGICLGENDTIYVTDTDNYRIQHFMDNGTLIREWGYRGYGIDAFQYPLAITTDKEGNVYVGDTILNEIKKFSSNGTFLTSFDLELFDWYIKPEPIGIDLDQQGNIYIVDTANVLVMKLNSTGFLQTILGYKNPPVKTFLSPYSVETDSEGNIYVVDTFNGRIQKFNNNQEYLMSFGSRGLAEDQLIFPADVAIDSQGNVYVTDYSGRRVKKYAANGTYLESWTGARAPFGIDIDTEDYVYVMDAARHQIRKFTSNGTFITAMGQQGLQTPGLFWYPLALAVDRDSNVYGCDGRGRITKYSGGGEYLRSWDIYTTRADENLPWFIGGVATDAFGYVYVTLPGRDEIQIFTAQGEYIDRFGIGGNQEGEFEFPFGVATDEIGNIYVSDVGRNKILKFSLPEPHPLTIALLFFNQGIVFILENFVSIGIVLTLGYTGISVIRTGPKNTVKGMVRHTKQAINLLIRTLRSPSGKIGFIITLILILMGLVGPLIFTNPEDTYYPFSPSPPSPDHLLGLDEWGRDVLTRLVWGAQSSVLESLIAVSIAVSFGAIIGALAGFFSDRRIGYLLDRFIDLFLTVPLIMLIVFSPMGGEASIFRSGFITGMGSWGITAKLVRARVLPVPQRMYYEAAKAAGAGKTRLLYKYVTPEVLPGLFAGVSYTTVIAVTLQATLDFFGFERAVGSINEVMISPVLSWGSMISYSRTYATLGLYNWWTVLPPAICLTLLVVSIIMVGSGFAEAYEAPIPAILKTHRREITKKRSISIRKRLNG